jgi:hypothetical protein
MALSALMPAMFSFVNLTITAVRTVAVPPRPPPNLAHAGVVGTCESASSPLHPTKYEKESKQQNTTINMKNKFCGKVNFFVFSMHGLSNCSSFSFGGGVPVVFVFSRQTVE